jgi:hypothetical protein
MEHIVIVGGRNSGKSRLAFALGQALDTDEIFIWHKNATNRFADPPKSVKVDYIIHDGQVPDGLTKYTLITITDIEN